jgi:hypothetical protein
MRHSRLHLSVTWQLAAIAILVVMSLSSAYAKAPKLPKCGKRCKRNMKGRLVCRIPKTAKVANCPVTSTFPPAAAPSPDDFCTLVPGTYENFYDCMDSYGQTGYYYDDKTQRYEYEDGTIVPGFEGPEPDCGDPPRRRRCRRNEISCSEGCKSGKCCSEEYRIPCSGNS